MDIPEEIRAAMAAAQQHMKGSDFRRAAKDVQAYLDSDDFRLARDAAVRGLERISSDPEFYATYIGNEYQELRYELEQQLAAIKYLYSISPELHVVRSKNNVTLQMDDQRRQIAMDSVEDIVSIEKLAGQIRLADAIDFYDFLTEYPMLGYMHEIGQRIFQFIESQDRLTIENTDLFRVRGYSATRKSPFSLREMIGPPFGAAPMNRFNNSGMNVSYFSEDRDVPMKEVGIRDGDRYTIVQVRLVQDKRMLDVRDIDVPLFRLCQSKVEKKSDYYSVEYILPNFVADCARKVGFDGLVYRSAVDDAKTNYVFFYLTPQDIEKTSRIDIGLE